MKFAIEFIFQDEKTGKLNVGFMVNAGEPEKVYRIDLTPKKLKTFAAFRKAVVAKFGFQLENPITYEAKKRPKLSKNDSISLLLGATESEVYWERILSDAFSRGKILKKFRGLVREIAKKGEESDLIREAEKAGQVFKWCHGHGGGWRQRLRINWRPRLAALPEKQRKRTARLMYAAWKRASWGTTE